MDMDALLKLRIRGGFLLNFMQRAHCT